MKQIRRSDRIINMPDGATYNENVRGGSFEVRGDYVQGDVLGNSVLGTLVVKAVEPGSNQWLAMEAACLLPSNTLNVMPFYVHMCEQFPEIFNDENLKADADRWWETALDFVQLHGIIIS